MKEKSDLMTTRVGLESYEVMAKHGFFDYEKDQSQPFIVSIWATLANDVIDDDIVQTLNYADLQAAVDSEVVNSQPVNLMETLCSKLVSNISLKPNSWFDINYELKSLMRHFHIQEVWP